ncbi:choline dehydrogenase-like flavoprotein [Streptacidiphilus sp. BW17]
MDADLIVVGAGLAGLMAAHELTSRGRRVALVDQENAASLGGQAVWSFGGLFFVDSPEQRRLGVERPGGHLPRWLPLLEPPRRTRRRPGDLQLTPHLAHLARHSRISLHTPRPTATPTERSRPTPDLEHSMVETTRPTITVFGAGSIGCHLGGALAAVADVTLIGRAPPWTSWLSAV